MKKLFFLGACLLALASRPVLAQTAGADVLMVRVMEHGAGESHLVIERPGQAPEEIKFKFWSNLSKGPSAAAGYLAALKKLYEQGYQIQAVIPGALIGTTGAGITESTLIFVKPLSK
jgi:hypothetical protein